MVSGDTISVGVTEGELLKIIDGAKDGGKIPIDFSTVFGAKGATGAKLPEKLVVAAAENKLPLEIAMSDGEIVTILWWYAGSPRLMDYEGLAGFSDIGEISDWTCPPCSGPMSMAYCKVTVQT